MRPFIDTSFLIALAGIIAASNAFLVTANQRFPFNNLSHHQYASSVSAADPASLLKRTLVARAASPAPAVNYTGPGYVPTTYLVELTAAAGSTQATQQQQDFISQASKKLNIKLRQGFGRLMNAVAIDVYDGGEWNMQDVATLSTVMTIEPLLSSNGHSPVVHAVGKDATRLQRRQSSGTQADPNDGAGVKVGIIDSGIDYGHPALGGCFGSGCKVAYGYDFVGDAYTGAYYPDPGWQAIPDSDPMDECNGHGTHVAGLIAGKATGIDSAAPAATLGAYRVLGCTGSVAVDIIIQAMERAAADGMDVINISIGSGKFFNDYPDARAAQALVNAGITVVASAGNDGDLGMSTMSSPGTAPGVITVGSVNPDKLMSFSFTVTSSKKTYDYLPASMSPIPSTASTTVAAVEAASPDGCKTLTGKYTNQFVLVTRGNCTFNAKALNAKNAGAAGIIIANTDNGNIDFPVIDAQDDTYALIISMADGDELRTLLSKAGTAGTAVVWNQDVSSSNPAHQGGWSDFSSDGPTANMTSVKPEVSMSGVRLYSTYPRALGSFALLTGTSMSSPRVAGVAAVTVQKFMAGVPLAQRPIAVKRLVMQSAVHKIWPSWMWNSTTVNQTFAQPIIYSGVGVPNVLSSNESAWGVDPMAAGWVNPIPEGNNAATHKFTLTLTGNLPPGNVTFHHLQSVAISNWNDRVRVGELTDTADNYFSASPHSVIIEPSTNVASINTLRSEKVTITMYPASLQNNAYYWLCSGLIRAEHVDAKTSAVSVRHIPYQTTVGYVNRVGPLVRNASYPRIDSIDTQGNVVTSTSTNRIVNAAGAYVAMRFRINLPTPWAFVVVENEAGVILGMASDSSGGPLDRTMDDPLDDTWAPWTGLIQAMPSFNKPVSNITAVPDGNYRLRVFAARAYTMPLNLYDRPTYDTSLSPPITVTGVAKSFNATQANLQSATAKAASGKLTSLLPKFGRTANRESLRGSTMQLMHMFTE